MSGFPIERKIGLVDVNRVMYEARKARSELLLAFLRGYLNIFLG